MHGGLLIGVNAGAATVARQPTGRPALSTAPQRAATSLGPTVRDEEPYMPSRRAQRRRTIAASVTGACLLAGVTACSGSSSPSNASSSSSAAATANASGAQPPASTKTPAPRPAGPNGVITAPASNPPSSGVPGGSETFPHIDTALDKYLAPHLLAMDGVQHIAYYPQPDQLQVYYDADATDADREAVYSYITSHS
jgi:hypothetical protein